MSYTEIYKFGKDGRAELFGEVQNSWRGAMAIWRIMEDRYLDSLPKPEWMSTKDYEEHGCSRTVVFSLAKDAPHPLKPVWDLWHDDRVTADDKIVLGTTFDNVVVMKEDISLVIDAFDSFEGETSLKGQADILRKAMEDDDVIAVAWNQTSVNGDAWEVYDEETQESDPYNLLVHTKHWCLFNKGNIDTNQEKDIEA